MAERIFTFVYYPLNCKECTMNLNLKKHKRIFCLLEKSNDDNKILNLGAKVATFKRYRASWDEKKMWREKCFYKLAERRNDSHINKETGEYSINNV